MTFPFSCHLVAKNRKCMYKKKKKNVFVIFELIQLISSITSFIRNIFLILESFLTVLIYLFIFSNDTSQKHFNLVFIRLFV